MEVSYKKLGTLPITRRRRMAQSRPQATLHIGRLGEYGMLHYAVVFFIIAIIAAVLGFGGIAAGAAASRKSCSSCF